MTAAGTTHPGPAEIAPAPSPSAGAGESERVSPRSELPPVAVNAAEAARIVGLGRSTVYRDWKELGLPGFYVGSRLLFAVADLEQWVAKRRRAAA